MFIRKLMIALVVAIVACFAQVPTAGAQYVYQVEESIQSFWSSEMTDGLQVSVSVFDSRGSYTSIFNDILTMGPMHSTFWYVDVRKLECTPTECRYVQTFYRNGEKITDLTENEISVEDEKVKLTLKRSGGVKSLRNDPREELVVETECAMVDDDRSVLIPFTGTLVYDGKNVSVKGDYTARSVTRSTWTERDSCYYFPEGLGKGEKAG